MSRFAKRLVLGIAIVAVVVIVAVLVWPRQEQGSPPANGLVQQSSGGNVTIDVTWMGAAEGLLLFDVAMNTHSVNLDLYELSELAMLRDDEGNEYPPVSWLSAPGGHHRGGP